MAAQVLSWADVNIILGVLSPELGQGNPQAFATGIMTRSYGHSV